MKIKTLLSLFTLVLTFCSFSVLAAEKYIYKWKNDKGVIQYTERQPAPGTKFERIKQTSTHASTTSSSTSNSPKSKDTKNEKEKSADDNYESWQKDNCRIANQNLDILLNAGRIAQDDGQGGKRLMTDEEKKSQIAQMQAQKEKYCAKSEGK